MEQEALAPLEAARELRAISEFDLALRQRMEGVIWIVLGLTLTSLFFSYAFAVLQDVPFGVLAVLWMPWTFSGFLIVWAMRKSLALAGTDDQSGRSSAWLFAGAAGAIVLALIAFRAGGREVAPSYGLLAIGVLALAPALVPSLGYTRLGRRVGLVLGALGILSSLSVLFAGGDGTWGTWAAASVCFGWVVGGAYQVLQG